MDLPAQLLNSVLFILNFFSFNDILLCSEIGTKLHVAHLEIVWSIYRRWSIKKIRMLSQSSAILFYRSEFLDLRKILIFDKVHLVRSVVPFIRSFRKMPYK